MNDKHFNSGQQTSILLKLLAIGNRQVQEGRLKPAAEVVARLRAKRSRASAD